MAALTFWITALEVLYVLTSRRLDLRIRLIWRLAVCWGLANEETTAMLSTTACSAADAHACTLINVQPRPLGAWNLEKWKLEIGCPPSASVVMYPWELLDHEYRTCYSHVWQVSRWCTNPDPQVLCVWLHDMPCTLTHLYEKWMKEDILWVWNSNILKPVAWC